MVKKALCTKAFRLFLNNLEDIFPLFFARFFMIKIN